MNLFVYGSLKENHPEAVIQGFTKRTDAAYPTIEPVGGRVQGQVMQVDDWSSKDQYEGCQPEDPENSLYWRLVSSNGIHMYVGNPEVAERYWPDPWDVDYDYEEAKEAVASVEVMY